MSKSDVIFKMSADDAALFASFRRVMKAQTQVERNTRRNNRAAKQGGGAFGGMRSSLGGLASGFVGAFGATRLLTGGLEEVQKAAERAVAFEDMMTPLLGLGENAKQIDTMKRSVLDYATATGAAMQDVTDLFFSVQSSAGNLPIAEQEQMRRAATLLTRTMGGGMQSNMRALNKLWQAYGDEIDTIDDAVDMLGKTIDMADADAEILASSLPTLVQNAKMFGMTAENMLGGYTLVTQAMEDASRSATAMRNAILRISNAEKEGIKLTGTFFEKMKQLADIDPDLMVDIFGDRSSAAANAMRNSTEGIAKNIEAINKAVAEGELLGKFMDRLSDSSYQAAENLKKVDRSMEGARLAGGGTDEAISMTEGWRLRKRGLMESLPPGLVDMWGVGHALTLGSYLAPGMKEQGAQAIHTETLRAAVTEGKDGAPASVDRMLMAEARQYAETHGIGANLGTFGTMGQWGIATGPRSRIEQRAEQMQSREPRAVAPPEPQGMPNSAEVLQELQAIRQELQKDSAANQATAEAVKGAGGGVLLRNRNAGV